jgi:uncharacterized protein
MKNKLKVIIIIFCFFVLPVLLMLTGIIPLKYRFYVLEIMTVTTIIYSILKHKRVSELGLTVTNLKSSFLQILPVTMIFSAVMIGIYLIGWIRLPENATIPWVFYLFFVFISSPSQEFLYRGFLFSLLSEININNNQKIIVSTLLYSFVHAIYWDIPTLVITFLIGLIWGYNYAKYNNLFGVIFSHSVLGAVAILVGLI